MPTTRRVKIMDKKEVSAVASNEDNTFIEHIDAIVGHSSHWGIDENDKP